MTERKLNCRLTEGFFQGAIERNACADICLKLNIRAIACRVGRATESGLLAYKNASCLKKLGND